MKMKPHLKNYLWGGKRLEILNKCNNLKAIAESWELSTNKNGKSIISNGFYKGNYLSNVISKFPEQFLGDIQVHYLPIIVKFIDAEQNLSIQVHPSDLDNSLGCEIKGKSEMWYIVDCKPGSYIYCGFNKDTTPEEVKERAENGTICDILNKVQVKKGNSFFIPAKTIHALGAGNLVAEIQQNSDSTFRIYDYKRKDNDGNLRKLHLDQAINVLNFKKTNIKKKPES